MAGVSHSLSRTSCIGKTPSVYKCHVALPWPSWLAGAPGGQAAGSGLREWKRGGFPPGCLLASLCARGPASPAPLAKGVPGPSLPLPGRDPVRQRSCSAVCPADDLPRDPASPQLPSQVGSLGLPSPPRPLCSALSERPHLEGEGAPGLSWAEQRPPFWGGDDPPGVLGVSGLEPGLRCPGSCYEGLGKLWQASGGGGEGREGEEGRTGEGAALRF